MHPEDMTLRETSQKGKYCMIPCIQSTYSRQIHKDKKIEWCLLGPGGGVGNWELLFNAYRIFIFQDGKEFRKLVTQLRKCT